MGDTRLERDDSEQLETTQGFCTTQGQKYEYLMSALLYLRSLRCETQFRLRSNLAGLGQFDDIFVDLRLVKQEVFCMQLKHKDRGGFIHREQLTGEHGKFSILNYYKSYCEIEDASRGRAKTKNSHILQNIDFDKISFVIFTNSICPHDPEDLNNLTAGERLLNTSTDEGCVFTFGPKDSEVWNLRKDCEDEDRFHAFLSKLRIFNNQTHADQLPDLIRQEVICLAGVRSHEADALCQRLMEAVQLWWSKENVFLTENSSLWYKALAEDLNRKMITVLYKADYRFIPECCDFFSEHLITGACINIVVPNVHRKLRCLKLLSTLENKFEDSYLLMDSNDVIRKKNHVVSICEKGYCAVLVIDVQIFPGIKQLTCGIHSESITTILVSGRTLENVPIVYQDLWTIGQFCKASQKRLLKTDVELQGEEVPLNTLCRDELSHSLSSKMIGALIRGNKVTFGAAPMDDVDLYIPRTFIHQTPLREEILHREHKHDLICVSGYPQEVGRSNSQNINEDIKILSYITQGSTAQEVCYNSHHPDSAAYNDLCTKYAGKKNVHWVAFQDGMLFWKETRGRNDVICKYIKKLSDRCKEEIDCCHAAEFLDDWKDKLRLITGEPGIGKSTLLKQIASITKERNPGSWVIVVELINFTYHFQKMSDCDVTLEYVVELLADAAEVSKSTCPVLAKMLIVDSLVNRGNIVVLLDAIDEISPLHKNEVLMIVQFLLETRVAEIWTTSRSILQHQLQMELSVVPLALKPFTEGEMNDFFKRYFNKETIHGRDDASHWLEQVKRLTDHIRTKESASSVSRNLCAIPLHAKMTADTVKELVCDSSDKLVKLNLNRLYECFLKTKLSLYYQKFGIDPHKAAITRVTDRERELFIESHIKCALFVTFEPEERNLLKVKEVEKEVNSILQRIEHEKTGLIDGVFDGKPKFIHFTICEYLVARWFKDTFEDEHNLDRLHTNSSMFLKFAQVFLSKFSSYKNRTQVRNKYEKLMEQRFCIVRLFLDQMLADGFSIHEAVLNGDSEEVEKTLDSGLLVSSVDRGGRLPLHLAAAHGHTEVVRILLGAESPVNERDKVLGWTPLRYADKVEAWSVADLLLQYGAKYRDMPIFRGMVKAQGVSNAFMFAVVSGHVDLMQLLWREWGMLTISHTYKISALITAAMKENRYVVQAIISNGTDINGFDRYGHTPLTYATECNAKSCVTLLIDVGADIDSRNKFGNTPLITGILKEDIDMMEYLLEMGADINCPDVTGCTPLYIAVERKLERVPEYLLEKGADVNHRSKEGMTPLLMAMMNKDQETIKTLLKMKADVNYPDKYGETPVLRALLANDLVTLQLLLEYGADLNQPHSDGETLLTKAIQRKLKRTATLLLEYGADPNCASSDGYTPLNHAVYTRDKELMQLLIFYKADINCPINKGWSLLHKAILNKEKDTVKWLLDFGADLNLMEQDGETPLLRAIENQDKETIRILVERGADVNCTNRHGETPLHKAVMFMSVDIIKLLLESGANPNVQDKEGCTPLHSVVRNWNSEIQKLLVNHGADVRVPNKEGTTPLAIAMFRKANGSFVTLSVNSSLSSVKFSKGDMT